MRAVLKREFRAYFQSPLGFVFIAALYFFTAYYFFTFNLYRNTTDMSNLFDQLFTVVLFLVPVLTMRLMSEDKRARTDQLLLTAPVSRIGIVLGKYLSALLVYLIAISGTLLMAVVMSFYASPDWPVVIGNLIGLVMLGASLIAICMFLSSLTESQVIAAVCGFASAGQTIVLIGGGMDFGVGAVMSSAAILTTSIMKQQDGHFIEVFVIAMLMGAAVGLLNGVCAVKIGLPAMIVTMAVSNVVSRLQYVLTQGSPLGYASPSFVASVSKRLFGLQFLPTIVLYALVIFPLVYFILNRSRFGKQVYLVGNNPVAARLNGVNVHKVQILTYVISGLFSAFAGMLGAAYMTSARCQMFDEYAYNSLIAVIIGGTTLSGGVGTYTGSIAGSLVMILLSNMLTTVGMAQPVRNICMGAVLILLLALYNREKNVRQ